MTDIGTALEKLIDVLQLEGHELFKIFAEVQFALAIQGAISIAALIIGICLGVVYGNRLAEHLIRKFDIDSYDSPIVNWIIPIICAIIGLFFLVLIADSITSIYMHAHYPDYYAAKELIRQIGYLT